jgi:LmbE family N-acetylglucosaminyl deacetylase
VMAEAPRDVLILAAHQDDCVIMAGEYAIAAKEAGRAVRVVYLTNGDSKDHNSQSERADKRNREAIAAWGCIGVAADSICCSGYAAAPVAGPSRITTENSNQIRRQFVELLRMLPADWTVFIPAPGESHVDHRTLRRIALECLSVVGRDDLHVYEAPEYNRYLSLVRMPRKTLMYILATIPVVRRWAVMHREIIAAEEFPCGARALIMPEDAARLERKRSMLKFFSSEDGEKLIRLFGARSRFRRITELNCALQERPWGYLPFEGYRLGISALAALAVIYGAAFVATAKLGKAAVSLGASKPTIAALGAVSVVAAAWICLFKAHDLRRRGFLISSVAGFLAGGCLLQ